LLSFLTFSYTFLHFPTFSFSFPFLSFTSARPLGGFLKIFPVKPPKGRAEGKKKKGKESKIKGK